ncbi:M48 family metalloprotease [Dechloromonas sp. XY25]|uniref:M48 family metalloprotease n=1 Tax=Dechloromonas hankyongensis TaxID=2908002 RepID=A0ABS9K5A9_9RHOO|nr:M48 family metalloprotease [Dechloromonas hankyongensis]MCG2578359.1 M48 family metalloprotease [Dechloromonas hankyongensis]
MRFPQRFVALTLACALAIQPLYADELPELGDIASSEFSLNTEKKIGLQIMHDIRWREPAYLDDADVEVYLNQLGGRLAAVSNDPGFGFFFFAINDPNINAFAMPGGYIGVHTGLILSAQTESELAGVLGHEISHVTQRHIARQIYQSKQVSMASMVAMALALLAARSSGQVAGAAIATTQAGAISSQLAFSRDFEREADRQGFDVLRKAGFDVRGMGAFFARLQQAVRLYENNATAYLRTHPLSGERLTDMQNREQAVPYRQVTDSVDFHLVRAKVRAMQGTPRDAVKDMEVLLQEKKFASEGAIHFGLAYARYRVRDWSGAEKELEAARRLKVMAAMLEHLRADLRLAQGDTTGGLAIYRDAMVRYPLNLALVYGYGAALTGARRFDDSLRFAEAQLTNYPEDVQLHKLRAESYAGLGRRAMQHRALAEVFILQGQTAGAVEQLMLAQKAGDANFYEMSSIDARLREMKRRQIDELKEKRN